MAMHVPSGVTRPLIAGIAVFALLSLAHAHGPAEWIQRGGYKNAAGELCCGERDCFELTDADVKVTPAGYFAISTIRSYQGGHGSAESQPISSTVAML